MNKPVYNVALQYDHSTCSGIIEGCPVLPRIVIHYPFAVQSINELPKHSIVPIQYAYTALQSFSADYSFVERTEFYSLIWPLPYPAMPLVTHTLYFAWEMLCRVVI